MGEALIGTALERESLTVAFGIDTEPETVHGIQVYAPDELSNLLAEHRPNVLLDFTAPHAPVENVQAAADAAVPIVVGTTGLDDEQVEALREAGETVPVLKATNFSRGIQALLDALESAAQTLPTYDVEVTETHHNRKVDAPSGTANTMLSALEIARDEAEVVHGRVGNQPREEAEIGVHSRRAGDVRGEHEVLFANNDEVLTLTHRAESRKVFAAGALDAAVWLVDQHPGFYDYADALEGGA